MAQDGENKKKITRWLKPLMFPYEEGEPKAFYIAVKHVSASGRLADVVTRKIAEPRDEPSFSSYIADTEQACLDDCEGSGGVQKYVIQGMDEAKHVIGRLTVRYTASRTEDELDAGFDSEPATALGITAQLMRHNEARERIDKAGWGAIIQQQRLTIESLTEKNNELIQKHLDMMGVMEELQSMKSERELAVLKESNSMEIKQRIGKTITLLLPALAKKLTGVDTAVTDPATVTMQELVTSLSESQLEALSGILTPEQTLAVLQLVKGEQEKTNGN